MTAQANSNEGHDRPALLPELLDAEQVAAICQWSPRHVMRMVETGRMPAPFKVGRCVRWSRRAIVQWIADGCPRMNLPAGAASARSWRRT